MFTKISDLQLLDKSFDKGSIKKYPKSFSQNLCFVFDDFVIDTLALKKYIDHHELKTECNNSSDEG